MNIRYLGAELDVESRNDLSPLLNDLGQDVIILHHGPINEMSHASFQLAQACYAGPDETIEGYCSLIENLSSESKAIWDSCFVRVFDIGFECGTSPSRYRFELRPLTITRVAAIGASVAFSLYPESIQTSPVNAEKKDGSCL